MNQKNLHLDPINHQYSKDGMAIPGVSEILDSCLGEFFKNDTVVRSMELGTEVHRLTALFDRGELDGDLVSGQSEPYFVAYKQFLKRYKPKIEKIEQLYLNNDADIPEYEYCGTLDRIMVIDGARWLIDIKTGGKYPRYSLQSAAYAMAYNNNAIEEDGCKRRGCLYLNKEGEYKLVEHENNDVDCETFISCLKVFYFKNPTYKERKVEIWD